MGNEPFRIHHSSFAAGLGITFETKMTEMSQTLYEQMEESAKLDDVIRKNLEGLGYGR